jgi:hypothetical protein
LTYREQTENIVLAAEASFHAQRAAGMTAMLIVLMLLFVLCAIDAVADRACNS